LKQPVVYIAAFLVKRDFSGVIARIQAAEALYCARGASQPSPLPRMKDSSTFGVFEAGEFLFSESHAALKRQRRGITLRE
jgi:hypothetical protein